MKKNSLVHVEEHAAQNRTLNYRELRVTRRHRRRPQAVELRTFDRPGERCEHERGHDRHHPVDVSRVHVLPLRLVHRYLGDGR